MYGLLRFAEEKSPVKPQQYQSDTARAQINIMPASQH